MMFLFAAPKTGFAKGALLRTPQRAYLVMVSDKDNPPQGYDKFKASFQVTA